MFADGAEPAPGSARPTRRAALPSFNLPTRMQGVYPYLDWCHHGPRPGALLVGRAVSRTQSPSLTEPPVVVGVGEHAP